MVLSCAAYPACVAAGCSKIALAGRAVRTAHREAVPSDLMCDFLMYLHKLFVVQFASSPMFPASEGNKKSLLRFILYSFVFSVRSSF